MFQELIRQMNNDERVVLQELVAHTDSPVTLLGTLKWLAIWSGGLVFCGLLAWTLVVLGVNPIIGGIFGGIIGVAGIICVYALILLIGSYFRWRRFYGEFRHRDVPEIAAALDDGRVAIKRVEAKAVIEIEEFEDEGPGYIFDVGDQKILFLKGQWYSPVRDDMEWPNSTFESVRTVHGNRWVGIFCNGQRLDPRKVISTSECKDEFVWAEREDLLEGDINTFAQSLLKAS